MMRYWIALFGFFVCSNSYLNKFVSKYGVPMNISEELMEELESEERVARELRNLEVVTSSSTGICSDDAVIMDHLLNGYDKHRIPGGGNVKVDVEVRNTLFVSNTKIWVQEVSKIIELTSEFELDIYVTELWTDPSLAFEHLNPCKRNISVDGAKILSQIWNPKVSVDYVNYISRLVS